MFYGGTYVVVLVGPVGSCRMRAGGVLVVVVVCSVLVSLWLMTRLQGDVCSVLDACCLLPAPFIQAVPLAHISTGSVPRPAATPVVPIATTATTAAAPQLPAAGVAVAVGAAATAADSSASSACQPTDVPPVMASLQADAGAESLPPDAQDQAGPSEAMLAPGDE